MDCRENILAGSPYGGVAILYRKTIGEAIKVDISNKRMCALRVQSDDKLNNIIFVSVYMPCDALSVSQCRDDYVDVISELENMLNRFNEAQFFICGDWNTDPSRQSDFRDFRLNNVLELCWDHPLSKPGSAYDDHELNHRSCIDHFVMLLMIFQRTKVYCVIENPLNPSDHNLISFRFDWAFDMILFTERHYHDKKIAWHRVMDDHIASYKNELDNMLEEMEIHPCILHWPDKGCTERWHHDAINDICNNLIVMSGCRGGGLLSQSEGRCQREARVEL